MIEIGGGVLLARTFRFLLPVALFAACTVAQSPAPENHFQEAGSAPVLLHSTFAHGYRHGYEEGYHLGNTDINMGRALREKSLALHDVKTGYSSQFGSRSVFDKGFQAGLKAGYIDGYQGRSFRAVDTLRAVADDLEESPFPADPNHTYFDQGFLTGYNDGYERGGTDNSSQMDFRYVGCGRWHSNNEPEPPTTASYCEGYRRGFVVGHADGLVLRPGTTTLEASR